MHIRTQVRNAAVTRLAGLSFTGAHVYASRVRPVDSTLMPCLLIYTDEEELGPATMHGTYARALTLAVKIVAEQSGEGIDALLDNIAEEVEAELGSSTPLLVGASQQLTLTGITVEFDDEGEKPAGSLTLTYRFEYFTTTAAPGTAL